MKINILGVDLPVSDKVIYATEEASREYINAIKKTSNRRMYQLGYDEGYRKAQSETRAHYYDRVRKEERNAVLSEVEREVEKEYGDEHPRAQAITRNDISTIINNLKVK